MKPGRSVLWDPCSFSLLLFERFCFQYLFEIQPPNKLIIEFIYIRSFLLYDGFPGTDDIFLEYPPVCFICFDEVLIFKIKTFFLILFPLL